MSNCCTCAGYHEMNLDWLINQIKIALKEWAEMQKEFTDLNAAFEDLKSYVNNYFDNLDVQKEINNKLDEMLKSGELQQIFGDYLHFTFTYDTFNELSGINNLLVGAIYTTKGYNSINDNGGCQYIYSSTPGDLYIKVNNMYFNLIWDHKNINVCQLGIISGSTLNDYWEMLTNFAKNNNCGLYFPKGNYYIEPVNDNYALTSEFIPLIGDDSNIIFNSTFTSSNNGILFTGNNYNYNAKITGLKFYPQTPNTVNNAITFQFNQLNNIFYNLIISNNYFGEFYGYAIYSDGFSNGGFNNCKIINNIAYNKFIYFHNLGDSNQISGNSLYASQKYQLGGYVLDITNASGSANLLISDNNCSGGLGIFTNCRKCNIINNQIENVFQNVDYLLSVTGACALIQGNNFNGRAYSTPIYINSQSGVITANEFYFTTSKKIINSIHLVSFNDNVVYDGNDAVYILKSNMFTGLLTNAYYKNEKGCNFIIDNSLNLWAQYVSTNSVTIPVGLSLLISSGTYTVNSEATITINNKTSILFSGSDGLWTIVSPVRESTI